MKLNTIARKIQTFLKKPAILFIKIWYLAEPIVSDKTFLRVVFRLKVGYWPDLKNPRSFNEKLQWLKLYDKHPEYTEMVDKVAAKDYVARIIGDKYIIPTIGIWDCVDEIEWTKLPKRFVIKASHDSGGVVVCKDKTKLDISEAKNLLSGAGKKDYTRYNKEYPYKYVPHRFIAEQLLDNGFDEDIPDYDLKDYKFFCFDGNVKFFKIDFDRFVDHHANYYSVDGSLLEFGEADLPPIPNKKMEIPSNLNEMISLAEKLSEGFTFIRVDLYNVKGFIYFGELTFFPASGMGRFTSSEWDYKIGEYIKLPSKT